MTIKAQLVVLAAILLTSCGTQDLPSCGDRDAVDLLRQLVVENAGAVFDAKVSKNDPMQLITMMGLGVGLTSERGGNFLISKEDAEKIEWKFKNYRTTSLNQQTHIRTCAVDVAYGKQSQTAGTFPLAYTISFTDDSHLYVQLRD